MLNFLKTLLLLAISLLVVTVLAEFVVRIAFHDITTTPNMQTWFGQRWRTQNVAENSLGFRESEITQLPPQGSYRIAIVGDSFTFGQGIPTAERFSDLMEVTLNARSGRAIEVLNFGQPGATTFEELQILQEFILPLQPDFIIVQWLPNDFEDLQGRWQQRGSLLIADRKLHRQMMLNSALYFLLNTQWNALSRIIGNSGIEYTDYLLSPLQVPGSDEYRNALQPMADMLSVLQGSGTEYAVVLHPMLSEDLGADYELAPLHAAVLQACATVDAVCIDLTPVFAELGPDFDFTSLWVNRFDAHPGSAANKMVADYLVEVLGPEFVLDE